MKPADIKKTLDEVIDLLAHDPYPYLSHPDKDFTRKRKIVSRFFRKSKI